MCETSKKNDANFDDNDKKTQKKWLDNVWMNYVFSIIIYASNN